MPRPKGFDPETAVDDAMVLFWKQGYEVTSIPQLERHLGINRFSIYDTFDSKRTLFIRSLDRYIGMLRQELVAPLENGEAGLSDIRTFLAQFRGLFLSGDVPPGCMLCNTAIEMGNRDDEIAGLVKAYFDTVEAGFLAAFKRARKRSEIVGTPRDLKARAKALRSALVGVLVELRLAQDPRDTESTIAALEIQFL